MSTKPGYRARLPSTLLQAKHQALRAYTPNTLCGLRKHIAKLHDGARTRVDLAVLDYNNGGDIVSIAAVQCVQDGNPRMVQKICQHYCLLDQVVWIAAAEFGDLTTLKWAKEMRRNMRYIPTDMFAYVHPDVLNWLFVIDPDIIAGSVGLISSISREGRDWCFGKGLVSPTFNERDALRFALQTGVYDEEYLLSFSKDNTFSVHGLVHSLDGFLNSNYYKHCPYSKKIMPRIIQKMEGDPKSLPARIYGAMQFVEAHDSMITVFGFSVADLGDIYL